MIKGKTNLVEGEVFVRFHEDGLKIEIEDANANIRFLDIEFDQKQTLRAMSGVKGAKATLKVRGLEYIGKKHENATFEFKIPQAAKGLDRYQDRKQYWETLCKIGQIQIESERPNEGWILDNYFGSQTSFFSKDGEDYVRGRIRRWI